MRNLIKLTLFAAVLALGACGSSNNTPNTGSGGSGGSAQGGSGGGATGGSGGGSGGSNADAGSDAPAGPKTIADCVAKGGTDQDVSNCIINLPVDTTVTVQTVNFTPAANFDDCKMQ